jgi:trimethylamine:corrinoid methyltransferase-like protein
VANITPIRPSFGVQVLSAEQVKEIKSATLYLLEHVGVQFPSQRALRVFADHGALVDPERQIVRLSSHLVTEAMSHAPRTYTLSGRAEGTELLLDGTQS